MVPTSVHYLFYFSVSSTKLDKNYGKACVWSKTQSSAGHIVGPQHCQVFAV